MGSIALDREINGAAVRAVLWSQSLQQWWSTGNSLTAGDKKWIMGAASASG